MERWRHSMTARSTFKQADATRALRAAVAAGMKPSECVIGPDGAIRLVFRDAPVTGTANPLDRVLTR